MRRSVAEPTGHRATGRKLISWQCELHRMIADKEALRPLNFSGALSHPVNGNWIRLLTLLLIIYHSV